jgi:hypothetical protein
MRVLFAVASGIALLGVSSNGVADTVSMNFVENATNQVFAGGQMIGPLQTDSAFWNHNSVPSTGDWINGTLTGLMDGNGTATGIDVQWQCTNNWYNGDGTLDDEHKLSVGYLDDGDTGGGNGVIITLTNIPYATYKIYGLFASDNATDVYNYDVNGAWAFAGGVGTTAPVYPNIDVNFLNNGEYWTEIDPGVVQGNYWTADTSGATCVVTGQVRGGTIRGCLTGVIIESTSSPYIPYCFGDFGVDAPCPCGNDNDGSVPGSGCANGVFASGAQLSGSGISSVSLDSLVLATTSLQPSNSGLYFQANNDLSPGNVWGDGLQCAGGGLIRLGVRFSDGAGYSDTSGYAYTISARTGVAAGETKYYQCWYRNPNGSPCGTDFNSSNGLQVTWLP